MARPLVERLEFDLVRNRTELLEVVSSIEDLDYAPAAGMKSYREQLVEIGAMEAESLLFLTTGTVPPWSELEAQVVGSTLSEILASLEKIRSRLLQYLRSIDKEDLAQPLSVPTEWVSFVGDTTLEREELFRWLARHEYYHLAQIISYCWIQGISPYPNR